MDVYEILKLLIVIVCFVSAIAFGALGYINRGKTVSPMFWFISVPMLFWVGYYIRSLISGGGTQHQIFVRGGILVTCTSIMIIGVYCLAMWFKKRR